MTARPPRVAILSHRRCGASVVYRLVSPWLPTAALGGQPFEWAHAWGDVSQCFHQRSRQEAAALLDARLREGASFHHRQDTEAWDFNEMLLAGLKRAGYRVVWVDRALSVERLFSLAMAQHLQCLGVADVERWRARLAAGEQPPAIDPASLVQLVQAQAASQRWLENALAGTGLPCLRLPYEALFRHGVAAALETADELFAFAGLGMRQALVDDASLLRFVFSGAFYTEGLADHSATLHEAWLQIAAAVQQLTSHDGGR